MNGYTPGSTSGMIDCRKLQTTRNGQPVSEWLVNEASLRRHIEENELKWDDDAIVPPIVAGVATRPSLQHGDATNIDTAPRNAEIRPRDVAPPIGTGVAGDDAEPVQNNENEEDALATPIDDGDAIGETRSLASVLIENARLTAELEGTRELIEEIRQDKDFLRDELKDARDGRKDVTAIAQRMLETLEAIATGGRLMPSTGSTPASGTDEWPPNTIVQRHETAYRPAGDNKPDEPDPYRI